jgi:hypothetical protein
MAGISHIMCPSHTILHYCRRRFPGVKTGLHTVLCGSLGVRIRPGQDLADRLRAAQTAN